MGTCVITCGNPSRVVPWTKLDDMPAMRRIEEAYDDAKNKVDERIGKRYLKLFRKLVAKHNSENHAGKITICAAMGMCTVQIAGVSIEHDRRWNGWNKRKEASPLVRLLFDIDGALDYDWACSLDGEALN